jgi:hypothetical protein
MRGKEKGQAIQKSIIAEVLTKLDYKHMTGYEFDITLLPFAAPIGSDIMRVN